jgi:CRP/FNR family transcriptional regulator, cyclic AMP receptor protein
VRAGALVEPAVLVSDSPLPQAGSLGVDVARTSPLCGGMRAAAGLEHALGGDLVVSAWTRRGRVPLLVRGRLSAGGRRTRSRSFAHAPTNRSKSLKRCNRVDFRDLGADALDCSGTAISMSLMPSRGASRQPTLLERGGPAARAFPRTRMTNNRFDDGLPSTQVALGRSRMSAPATGPNPKTGLAGRREAIRLLDADPDLGAGLTPERREEADALVVHAEQLGVGAWQIARVRAPSGEYLGLLVLDGVISRELIIADTVSVELLGPGDLIRPWPAPDRTRLLRVDVRWWVLSSTSVAVLDRRVAAELAAWPEIMACLLDRLTERSERLAITLAISQLTRVDRRLLTLFWHLAERWGRVGTDGVVVPLALTHRMLGQLVGARRPTVSSALRELRERDELVRGLDGSWLLRGEPPAPALARTTRFTLSHRHPNDLLRPTR